MILSRSSVGASRAATSIKCVLMRNRPEWRLDKTQNFLTQRFALARSGAVNEENAS
jgi:hypothetical protein